MYRKVKRDGSFFLSPYIQREMPWITEMPTIFLPSRLYVNAIEKKSHRSFPDNRSPYPTTSKPSRVPASCRSSLYQVVIAEKVFAAGAVFDVIG